MFTGLIQAKGEFRELNDARLRLNVPKDAWPDPFQIGESISVNGCCLTLALLDEFAEFDLTDETLSRTTFSKLQPGTELNLERAMRKNDRIGGHVVQGHVDGVGRLVSRRGEVFRFEVPEDGAKFLLDKGSIAIDGISLTVVSPKGREFDVAVIPHTLTSTNLAELAEGSPVNIEYDMAIKYMAQVASR
jgi:riboflavin synthase